MSKGYSVTATTIIEAPVEMVYAIIADYRDGHPHILPKQYFTALEVEEGGVGAGTRIRFQMRVLGRRQTFHAAITEPEPGRVLVETNLDGGAVTTFEVRPVENRWRCRVTITTELQTRGGLLGRTERRLTRLLLRRIYAQELALLAAFAEGRLRTRRAPAARTPLVRLKRADLMTARRG
jgi:uncharacterized protein YndB with AHSA1/START domain